MAKSKRKSSPRSSTANSHFAYITPQVLTWAIERSGQSRESIAAHLRIKLEDLKRWESGAAPQFSKAERLASYLRVPFGVLFLSEPPDMSVKLPDMRRLPVSYKQSPDFIELVYDAMIRQDWYRDWMKAEDEAPLPFVAKFSIKSSTKTVAADIRKALGMGPALRQSVKRQTQYMTALSDAAESLGVLVMRSGYVKNFNLRPVSVSEFQGFALADPLAPVVFVNANDYDTAQVFTLIHELVHIWIGQTGISKPSEGVSNTNAIETFCNQTTAEVLVPEAEFRSAWNTDTGDARVGRLARRYFVSRLVIVNRAFELDLITKTEQRRLKKGLVFPIVNEVEKSKKPGGNFYATAAIRAGHRLTDRVITQVVRGTLVLRDAGRLLGMSQFAMAKFASAPSARAS